MVLEIPTSEGFWVPDVDHSEPHYCEFEVKRSQFLTHVIRARSAECASEWIRGLRNAHPKANHVCWAYIAGDPSTTQRSMSDDGEPSGTAGRPMLNVLEHSGMGEIAVAVVRYFGGQKLGTGGLQRAYSDAVKLGLDNLPTKLFTPQASLRCQISFGQESRLRHVLAQFSVDSLVVDYCLPLQFPNEQLLVGEQALTATWQMSEAHTDACRQQIVNALAGQVLWL